MQHNTILEEIYSRNELIWGKEAQKHLFGKHVIVFGLGGVGSYAAEALARSGIGKFTLIDFDCVTPSNINRQLLATIPDIGKPKTELMKARLESINPHIQTNIIQDFYTETLNTIFEGEKVDFVVDAIDTLKYKIDLICSCKARNIPVITSMGAGNRLDPTKLYLADVSEVRPHGCSFIKNVLSRLKSRGITEGLPVVTSTEKPFNLEKKDFTENITNGHGETIEIRKFIPGSTPFVPPVAGYFMASYIIRTFIKQVNK